jgi:hypothetical protein
MMIYTKYKWIFSSCVPAIIAGLIATFLVSSKASWAETETAPCQMTDRPDVAFKGLVLSVDAGSSPDSQVIFKVVDIIDGSVGKTINVIRNSQQLDVNKEYMVFLHRDPSKGGAYSLGACGQAQLTETDPLDLDVQPYDIIFRGRVISVDTGSSPNSQVSFQVLNSYKGNVGNKINILRNSEQFEVNKDYVVFLRSDPSKAGAYSFGANGEAKSIVTIDPPTDKVFSGGVLDGDLKHTNFTGADLKNVDFGKSTLNKSQFNNADLSGADFGNTDLKGGFFPDNQLRTSHEPVPDDVDLTGAKFDETTRWAAGFFPFDKGGILVSGKQAREAPPLVTDVMQGPADIEGLPHVPKLQLQGQGTYLIDGIHIGHYNYISAENGKPDLIKVYVAGLMGHASLHKNHKMHTSETRTDEFKNLSIEGDPGLDTVLLDGCFTWEWKGVSAGGINKDLGNNKFVSIGQYPYMAPASSGYQVKVLIQEGLKVAFSKDCYHPPLPPLVQDAGPIKKDNTATTAQDDSALLEKLKKEVSFLEQYWAHFPPQLIAMPPRPEREGDCVEGQLIFTKAGRYPIDVPPTCTHMLVKAWGGHGGGSIRAGGDGGFSMGLIDIPQGAKLEAIVGQSNNQTDGTDTELLINDSPALIAGGGKAYKLGEEAGFPGGGRNKDDLLDTKSTFYLSTDIGALGMTPEYGITLWGRANDNDPYHDGLGRDGQIALIWPAPAPEQFLTSIVAIGADVFKSMQPRQEAVDAGGRMIIKDSAYHDQHCKYNVGILDSATDTTGHIVMKATCLENTAPIEYKPKTSENIAAYEAFVESLRQKQREQQQKEEKMLEQIPIQYRMSMAAQGIADKIKGNGAVSPTGKDSLSVSPPDLMSPLVNLIKEGKLPTEFVHHESHDYHLTNDVYVADALDLEKKANIDAHHATIRLKNDLRVPEAIEIFESGWGTYMVRDNSCNTLEKGKPIYVLSPLSHTGVIPAMNLIKTDYQYPYPYTDFIIFGRGISPKDIITQGNQIIDTKTKDSIQFTSAPCVNILFSDK